MRKCFLLVFLFAGLFQSQAQGPQQYSFWHYTTEDGLSHDEVNCILKDREGFMWFGTAAGLNRFDGRSFKIFRPAPGDSTTLPSESIVGLSQDEQGRIWVSTFKGLCWYEPREGRFYQLNLQKLPAENLAGYGVSQVVFDQKGFGWFVCNGYLCRLSPGDLQVALFEIPDEYGPNGSVFIDRRGYFWITMVNKVIRFDLEMRRFHSYFGRHAKDPAMRYDAGYFYEDSSGRLWCSTWGGGLFQYDPRRDKFIDYPDGPQIATCFLREQGPDSQANFWIGGGIYGLYTYSLSENQAYQMYPNPHEPFSHNGSMAKTMLCDPETGMIWIGTSKGIEKYDPYAIRFQRGHIPIGQDISQFSFVSDFLQDRLDPQGNTYWISVWGSGLFRWNRRQNDFQRLTIYDGLPSHEIFQTLQDRQGRLLMAVFGGVHVFDPATQRHSQITGFMKTPGINHKVLSILEDEQGTLWIGANHEGLFRYNPSDGKVRPVPYCDSLSATMGGRHITRLALDKERRIWMSTQNGIYIHDPSTGRNLHLEKDLPLKLHCDDIIAAKDGHLWVASRNGIYKFDAQGKVKAHFADGQALATNEVYRVLEDQRGFIWIGTNKGLFRLDPESGPLESFDKSDGLFSNVIFDGFSILPSGEIFMGFQNAFNYFHPDRVPRNRTAPKVVLTSLRVMDQERTLAPGKMLVLRPRENIVSFEFAALNFSQSEKNRYAVKLEGFNEEWVYPPQPAATYTNLDGGFYTLRVRATNNDGIWSEEELVVPIRIIPPFHRSWYFPLFLVLVLTGLSLAVAHYRKLQRLHLEDIRNRIARDLHDDMGSTLSSIRFFSEYAQAQVSAEKPEVVPVLQRISSSAASLSESMQDIIWTINSRHDKLDDLVTRMREFGFRTLEARQIQFSAQISKGFRPMRLSIGQRRNLYLIFKEAVNNASKYSGCTEVDLFLTIVRNNLKMIIEDNGRGFDPQAASNGNGLRNMRQRAQELGGELTVESQPGKGTRIEVLARIR